MISRRHYRIAGFTLIEMLVAVAILGIIGAIVAVFIKAPMDAYVDTSRRAGLTESADAAIRRIRRDVRSALPNSVRVTNSGSGSCVELLPVMAGGRYRALQSSTATGDILDFTTTDTSFDVLAQSKLATLSAGTYLVAIYNLGISGADAYAGDNTATISAASSTSITLSAGKQFPFESPGKHFQVIPNYSVVYSCAGDGYLRRTTRSITSSKLAACPSNGSVLAGNVSACSFSYETMTAAQRNNILAISLTLTASGESVRLYDQVGVSNVP